MQPQIEITLAAKVKITPTAAFRLNTYLILMIISYLLRPIKFPSYSDFGLDWRTIAVSRNFYRNIGDSLPAT